MNNIVPISQARMPSAMRARLKAGAAVNSNFAEGIADSFPLLSIKGKVFRIRINGVETPLVDPQTRQVIPYLDVVLVNASPLLSKAYYEKGFSEGDFDAPLCWSLDSIKPDERVANKINPTCPNCPKNEFGSRMTDSGKKAKACSDARRVAVVMPGQLNQAGKEPMVFMLRVPQSSLKNLKAYSQNLDRQDWELAGCVTRMSFDYNEAFPKLVFNFVDGLNDAEYEEVLKIADAPGTEAMLRAPDFEAGVSEQPGADNPKTEARVRQDTPVFDDATATEPVPEATVPPRRPARAEAPAAEPEPQQESTPKIKPVEGKLIELPDGQLFDPMTGEYIERPAPKVEMPTLDPDTVSLPDGRFFNQSSRQFVTGPEVGAPPVTAAEPPKRKPGRKPRASAVAEAPAAEAAPQTAAVMETVETEEDDPQTSQDVHTNGVDVTPARQTVAPAPGGLEAILKAALPNKGK